MAQYQLVLRVGPSPGKVFPLMKNEITIGRDINNEIVINDAEVSRQHTQLTLTTEGYMVEDLGSTNGTWIKEQRLAGQHQLVSGETIRLGDNITLLYELVGADPDATVASSGMPEGIATQQPIPEPPPAQAAPPPRIQQAPPPPQEDQFAGYVPDSPPTPKRKSRIGLIIAIVALVVLCICLIAGLIYVDNNFLWCEISWDMLPGC